VLIHGGAGGVGHFAVQLAKWKQARVIATGSQGNEGFLRELGGDVFIDYAGVRFENVAREVDVVLDTVGGETQARSWAVLRPGGALVTTVALEMPAEARQRDLRGSQVATRTDVGQLDELAGLIDNQVVRPVLSRILPLNQARRAHDLMEARHVRGKLVLDVIG
jgi:NADPH:quinone reductase-like Zn-dependent oxidoreductase